MAKYFCFKLGEKSNGKDNYTMPILRQFKLTCG